MKKRLLLTAILFAAGALLMAQDVTLTINFSGFIPNEGTINIVVISEENAKTRGSTPFFTDTFDATTTNLKYTMTMPEGYYFISVFQDLNENEELDLSFVRIPKEPIGLSNYDFTSIPGGFDKQKVYVSNEQNEISIIVKKI